jgi:hypothetical protein
MNRDEFFAKKATKPKTDDATLPDGSVMKVRKLSQAEVEHLTKNYSSSPGKSAEGLRYIVVKSAIDDEGKRIFQDEDISQLAEMDFDIVKTIASKASELSGLKLDPNG